MTLINSISGIRGTIGGEPGDSFTPVDVVTFISAYSVFLNKRKKSVRAKVVLGRDARTSGPMVERIVSGTLMACGIDVVLIGLATTPTVEMAVPEEGADGGIILTASHNPAQWNALKLLNGKGEFLSANDGKELMEVIRANEYNYADYDKLGKISEKDCYNDFHIQKIIDLELVDVEKIREKDFKIVIDCVNSVGGVVIPDLLRKLGVKDVIELYTTPDGNFPHNPEPLPENLTEISAKVKETGADLGFVVDPDVDRLAVICEDGTIFGEEYTLVAVADYVLGKTPGNTASNLSSSRALKDITEEKGLEYYASAVGEVNVVEKMKEKNCVIGGEGNGGVIYPELHYGRDALVGIALFLSHLSEKNMVCSELKKTYPEYVISKNKISLEKGIDTDLLLSKIKMYYSEYSVNDIDGVKVDFPEGWVHLRKSNTEPIIRIYSEHKNKNEANKLAEQVLTIIKKL